MAAWYTPFYETVRLYRAQNPLMGGCVAFLFLNLFFFLQLFCISLCYYVYVFILCGSILESRTRVCIYLIIYHILLFMLAWSLAKTYFTRESTVPLIYYVDPETDAALKSVTPVVDGRYRSEISNSQQIEAQKKILIDVAEAKNLIFAEVDEQGRLRYCYICGLIKPDRCRHCSSCGFCILKFDHHCPFLNKCISYKNYKFFILYLSYGIASAICIEGLVYSLSNINETRTSEESLTYWIHTISLIISMSFLATISYMPFGDLFCYHIGLLSTNQTTCDQAKEPIIRDDKLANYDLGAYNNMQQVFGWGLWLFPIGTFVEDGLHYKINYSPKFAGPFEVLRCQSTPNISDV